MEARCINLPSCYLDMLELAIVGFGKGGPFRKVHFLEILENVEILEILDNQPAECGKKGISDHFLDILENFEILEILDIPPLKDSFRNDPFFRSRDSAILTCSMNNE